MSGVVRSAIARLRRTIARIRYRLLLVNVLVAAVPVVGISFAQMHETQLLGALEADMIHQAELVRAAVVVEPTRTLADFEPMLAGAAEATRTRIRLLDAAGAVAADSHRDGPPEGAERAAPRLFSRNSSPNHDAEPPRPLEIVASLGKHRARPIWVPEGSKP